MISHLKAHIGPAGHGWVEIDGKRVKNCRGIKIDANQGRATVVIFELVATEVEIEIEPDIEAVVETTHLESANRTHAKLP